MGSCRAQSVYLTTLLLGRLSPLSGLTSIVHILSPETDQYIVGRGGGGGGGGGGGLKCIKHLFSTYHLGSP